MRPTVQSLAKFGLRVRNKTNRIFNFRKGLTQVPHDDQAVISDLFIWRKSRDWKTRFELLNLSHLIEPSDSASGHRVLFRIFNDQGKKIGEETVETGSLGRKSVIIDDMIPPDSTEFGTFACFHSTVPKILKNEKSFLAERGYTGFKWKDLDGMGYSHGNLDAISCSSGKTRLLGNYGYAKKRYSLQHVLTGEADYEIALVNPTNADQTLRIILADPEGKSSDALREIPSGGLLFEKFPIPAGQKFRLTIESRLYMARPVVFRLGENTMDVFHG